MDRFKVFGLPEEPLKNAAVPRMSVAENIAFRSFDKPPIASLGWWLSPGPMRGRREEPDRALPRQDAVARHADREPVRRQRAARVLARELSGDVDVLIVANPCFGLDFASVAEIRARSWSSATAARRCCSSRGPRRDPRTVRPRRGDVGRHDHLCRADRRRPTATPSASTWRGIDR
jgi:ABC-type uncharacterized transport system ATPase subunit